MAIIAINVMEVDDLTSSLGLQRALSHVRDYGAPDQIIYDDKMYMPGDIAMTLSEALHATPGTYISFEYTHPDTVRRIIISWVMTKGHNLELRNFRKEEE